MPDNPPTESPEHFQAQLQAHNRPSWGGGGSYTHSHKATVQNMLTTPSPTPIAPDYVKSGTVHTESVSSAPDGVTIAITVAIIVVFIAALVGGYIYHKRTKV